MSSLSQMGAEFRRWCDLPADILGCIYSRLSGRWLIDRVRSGAVCKHWRYASKLQPPSPSSCVSMFCSSPFRDDPTYYRSFTLSDGTLHHLDLIPDGFRFCGSHQHWLIINMREIDRFFLFNPFSGTQIPLPSLKSNPNYDPGRGYIRRAILSSSPTPGSDNSGFFVAILHYNKRVSLCSLTGSTYFSSTTMDDFQFQDIIFYQGMLFAINYHGEVYAIALNNDEEVRIVMKFELPREWHLPQQQARYYLIESRGKLVVARRGRRELECQLMNYGFSHWFSTTGFKLFELQSNPSHSQWVELGSLGGDALFLSTNGSKSVRATEYQGVEADHIYFTNDIYFHESGVFSMEDESITRFPHSAFTSKLAEIPRFERGTRMTEPVWIHVTCV